MHVEQPATIASFKKRRTVAAITCVVVLVFLAFNTRCSNRDPELMSDSMTKMSLSVSKNNAKVDTQDNDKNGDTTHTGVKLNKKKENATKQTQCIPAPSNISYCSESTVKKEKWVEPTQS